MDPNANWREQVELATRMQSRGDIRDTTADAEDGLRLSELVVALNDWISRGGFPPDAWDKKKH
jgi:hypothetical protein